ncbi:MAG: phosphatidylserine decarboxylase family protein [Acidobacteria bacterium]|nr:MAG: phosphatidylserine decarboxylase family protein [Acidobacteriota bacterium]
MTFARESLPFVLVPGLLAVALVALGVPGWSLAAAAVALATLLFFRIPTRSFEGPPEVLVAPANGLVTRVDSVVDELVGQGEMHRVVIFLSVFDVHVQRSPVAGEVVASRHSPGRKVAAFRPDAGEVNESHLTVLRDSRGLLFGVKQIAGLLARRVVAYQGVGSRVERGQLIGLIKFGSRVDLMVPSSYRIEVQKGDRLREGETPIARPDSIS